MLGPRKYNSTEGLFQGREEGSMVPNDRAIEVFTKGMKPKGSIIYFKIKKRLTKFEAPTGPKCTTYMSKRSILRITTSELLEGPLNLEGSNTSKRFVG